MVWAYKSLLTCLPFHTKETYLPFSLMSFPWVQNQQWHPLSRSGCPTWDSSWNPSTHVEMVPQVKVSWDFLLWSKYPSFKRKLSTLKKKKKRFPYIFLPVWPHRPHVPTSLLKKVGGPRDENGNNAHCQHHCLQIIGSPFAFWNVNLKHVKQYFWQWMR